MDEKTQVIIKTDCLGKTVVVIPHILFSGKRAIDWNHVEEYLLRYVGNKIQTQDECDVIRISGDFPDEYKESRYTRSSKGMNAKAKANAAQGIAEMIQIADSKQWQSNRKGKHEYDASKGWYRYHTRFALPVMNREGDILCFNIFSATLLVRHAKNDKLYLYDLQGIKKEGSNPPWTIG